MVLGTTRLQRTGLSLIRDKGERLVDAKTKKTIFNLALQSEAVTVKKQAAHQTRQAQNTNFRMFSGTEAKLIPSRSTAPSNLLTMRNSTWKRLDLPDPVRPTMPSYKKEKPPLICANLENRPDRRTIKSVLVTLVISCLAQVQGNKRLLEVNTSHLYYLY